MNYESRYPKSKDRDTTSVAGLLGRVIKSPSCLVPTAKLLGKKLQDPAEH